MSLCNDIIVYKQHTKDKKIQDIFLIFYYKFLYRFVRLIVFKGVGYYFLLFLLPTDLLYAY